MKHLALALLCLAAGSGLLRAQDDQQQKPQEEIPDFSSIDEYIYVPKTTLNFGFRYLGGTKASFRGSGKIETPSNENIGNGTASNVPRNYHDGTVGTDARTLTVDNGDGTTSQVAVNGSDGKTNTWSYLSSNQVDANGYMTFSTYSATVADTGTVQHTGRGAFGTELSVARDMGDLNKRFSWKLFAGFSVNDIQAGTTRNVAGTVSTTTDTYDLYGQTPPGAPYSAPSVSSITLTNSDGSDQTDSNGNSITQTVDTTTLLGNTPLQRASTPNVPTTTLLSDHWEVHGSYITLRFGPQLIWNLAPRLHVVVDVGPALIYAGSDYNVIETLTPPTGVEEIENLTAIESKLMVGYYADANLQYDLTDRTGMYVGSYYQNSGKYTQTISQPDGSYNTHVDLSNQSGIRTGLTYKF